MVWSHYLNEANLAEPVVSDDTDEDEEYLNDPDAYQ